MTTPHPRERLHEAGHRARTKRAKEFALFLYRVYRRQGRTPLVAMQMVYSATRGVAEDVSLPDGLRAEAAMQCYYASRYFNQINRRLFTPAGPYWVIGRQIDWVAAADALHWGD